MSFSPQLRWFLLLFLAGSITWKISARLSDSFDVRGDIVNFLRRQHFDAAVADATASGMPMITATAGPCRMLLVADTRWNPDALNDFAAPIDHFYMIYRGQIYSGGPTFAPVLQQKFLRTLRRLGVTRKETPLISVAAGTSCSIERLPWQELSDL